MLKLIEPYKVAIILAISLALLGGVFYWGYSTSSSKWALKWSQRDAADLAAAKKFTDEQRRIELKRIADADELQKNAESEKNRLAALLATSRGNAGRLQRSLEDALDVLRSGSNSPLNTSSPDAGKVGLLLADLYREINQRSTELAGEADAYYNAGLTCNKQWETLRAKQ